MRRMLTITAAAALMGGAALADTATGDIADVQPQAGVPTDAEILADARIGVECTDGVEYKPSAASGSPGSLVVNDVYYVPCDNIEPAGTAVPDQGTPADAGTGTNGQ